KTSICDLVGIRSEGDDTGEMEETLRTGRKEKKKQTSGRSSSTVEMKTGESRWWQRETVTQSTANLLTTFSYIAKNGKERAISLISSSPSSAI
ncbi:unnamed protein product, partial [Amoebophrya sp. A25]